MIIQKTMYFQKSKYSICFFIYAYDMHIDKLLSSPYLKVKNIELDSDFDFQLI